ncbi:MAG TPA: hypothetical protein VK483_08360 [Chitinophagaceae bacterium]|nr:hypothetical protein [Chitinophagaceae bacterium]
MKSDSKKPASPRQQTFPVSNEVFKMVYDAPSSLPGKHKWITIDEDVRKIEQLLGMPAKTIGAPLWVSGDHRTCPKCKRETNWLDIVSSATKQVHSGAMIAKIVLGDKKYVNTEAPRAIADLNCFSCGTRIEGLRSFKCHNWAYAIGKIRKLILEMNKVKAK